MFDRSFGPNRRTILCLDMDSYFATVEQQENPHLRGKPVGVLKAAGRTCVIASSKEAKKYGVKTGTPLAEAKRLCPKLILVPADMEKYFRVTENFATLCRNFTPLVEMFSIDELFMDVTETEHLFGGALAIALELKEQIRKKLGNWLTCSVGISYNKFLAKLASKKNKPDGLFVITPENKDGVLLNTELAEVCGIGPRLEARLSGLGVRSFSQLRELPDAAIETQLGPHWPKVLKRLAQGEDMELGDVSYRSPVLTAENIPEQKSVSRTYTLFADTYDPRVVYQYIRNLSEEAAWKLRQMNLKGRQVGLAIRGGHSGVWNRQTLKTFTDDGRFVAKVGWELFQGLRWPGPVRFVGVFVGLLTNGLRLTTPLFPEDRRREKLLAAIDRLNHKFGQFTLYPAVLVDGEKIRPEVNGFLGDKAFRLKSPARDQPLQGES